jgi:glutaredoxin
LEPPGSAVSNRERRRHDRDHHLLAPKRELRSQGVDFHDVDIWEDRGKAELVRQATGGDEIVPTVQVGDRFLVNPSVDDVLSAA